VNTTETPSWSTLAESALLASEDSESHSVLHAEHLADEAVCTEVRKLAMEFPLPRYTRPVPAGGGVPA
jgi:hypothetical protein